MRSGVLNELEQVLIRENSEGGSELVIPIHRLRLKGDAKIAKAFTSRGARKE